eukprot:Hpha_TRINITY_DN16194_c7_g8::TRINITY_DN16194_c7_g8_i1::g.7200::m.7200/K05035/SLC6A2; solute carrier family 6 (neurotransmitter transporter, noradrenalin) member 2
MTDRRPSIEPLKVAEQQDKPVDTMEGHVDHPENKRDRWSSRVSFILAAVGSAIGLGNFWRFPYLVYKYGGGTFLIPYTVALFVVGIPMLQLELSVGQYSQAGDIRAFSKIHPTLKGVGIVSVLCSFAVIAYYSVVLAWTAIYFVESFKPQEPWRPWKDDDALHANALVNGAPCADRAFWHFFHEILGIMDSQCKWIGSEPAGTTPHGMGDSDSISGVQTGALVCVWVIVGASVLYGVKTASKVVLVSAPLPFVLAFILLIRAVTLDGASDGIDAYLGKWDFSLLREPQMWVDAVGQIFFSLSVCFGVMTSYGSYRPRDAPIAANVFIVSLTNCLFSFFCGFIVFGFLGYMAWDQTNECIKKGLLTPEECKVTVDDVTTASIPLVFIVFPTALYTLGSASHFFSVVTFLTLFLLGWDSAFSLLEAITTVILDADVNNKSIRSRIDDCIGRKWATPIVTVLVSIAGFLTGLAFTADVGLYWLDLVDHYVFNYAALLDGALQAVAVGWVWGIPAANRAMGKPCTTWFVGGAGAAAVIFIVMTASLAVKLAPCETKGEGASATETCYTGGEIVIGFVCFFLVLIGSWLQSYLASPQNMSVSEWMSAMFFTGSSHLADFVDEVGGVGKGNRVKDFFAAIWRCWWCFMIQYVSPVALIMLVILIFKKDVDEPYEGYQTWMQNIGFVGVGILILVFLVPLFIATSGQVQDLPAGRSDSTDRVIDATAPKSPEAGANRRKSFTEMVPQMVPPRIVSDEEPASPPAPAQSP